MNVSTCSASHVTSKVSCSFCLTDESFNRSKSDSDIKALQVCADFLKDSSQKLTDLTTGDTFSGIVKIPGRCLVNPITEIFKAEDITTLIAIAHEWISDDIANELSELNDYPLEEDEFPLNAHSVKHFLQYSFSKGIRNPVLSVTHDGLLQADWDNNEENANISIRFLAEDKAWITSRTNELKGTVEVSMTSLLANVMPLNLPGWAND